MSESRYLKFLPDVFREDGSGVSPGFTGRFLLAFERILSGVEAENEVPGAELEVPLSFEEIQQKIEKYFDPDTTPPQMLRWLAGWVALTLDETKDWMGDDYGATDVYQEQLAPLSEVSTGAKNRRFIKGVASIYRKRGTIQGLKDMIELYTDTGAAIENVENVKIREFSNPYQVGIASTVGEDMMVDERPYYFQVSILLTSYNRDIFEQNIRAIRKIIDQEKPAHTYYDLVADTPTMQIGQTVNVNGTEVKTSVINSTTLLGGMLI